MFEFKGDWEFDLALPVLSKIYADHWFGGARVTDYQKRIENGFMSVEIRDVRDYDPDPKPYQLNALRYIQNFEMDIVRSLYEVMKNIINPAHVGYCGDDEWLKPLNSYQDLGKTILLSQIQILQEEKDGMAYYALMCEYIGDYEHGLVITMYRDEYIGSAGSCEIDYEGIARHRGGYTQAEKDANSRLNESGKGKLQVPHEKYGKLKPWQIDANGIYLWRLIQNAENNQQIINYIENGDLDVNIPISSYWGDGLVGAADNANNIELLEYFISKGGALNSIHFKYLNLNFNEEKVSFYLSKGADINATNYYGQTPLFVDLYHYYNNESRINRIGDEKVISALVEKNKKLVYQIKFMLANGADPESCNTKGESYRTIFLDMFKKYKDEYNILDKIDLIVGGKSLKSINKPKEKLKGNGIWEKLRSFWS